MSTLLVVSNNIKGIVIDKISKEPLIGATIQIPNSSIGTIADFDGYFELPVNIGTYTLEIKYISYKTKQLPNIQVKNNNPIELEIELEPESQVLGDVTVVAQLKKNTDIALLTSTKNSLLVQSGVSAQQITKTQDRDASEVIRRVPGISIIDEKFVMVRGLSQRYNNVWINNSAVPSSEADSRAFSFDIIPSSQLDNMLIIKSPAPEYPADFTGGFILVNTKDMPSEDSFSVSIGGNINDQTHFHDFLQSKKSGTDFLGFDNGLRNLDGGIKRNMNTFEGQEAIDLMNNGLNNDWSIKNKKPIADLRINAAANKKWETEDGKQIGLLTTINYSNSYKTFLDMENSLFGSYDIDHGHSVYLRKSTDNQYNNDVKLGAMLNLTYIPVNNRAHYEFKNIFNQLGKNRYTSRVGIDAQSNNEVSMEYYYSSRTTYNGQFTGKYNYDNSKWNWSAGYAYANRNLPDRRRILLNDELEVGKIGLTTGNDISRDFTKLNEHILSGNVNYEYSFNFDTFKPVLKTGAYTEYRTRDYDTRRFFYNWNRQNNTLPDNFRYLDPVNEMLIPENYGPDKLHLFEEIRKINDYKGNNIIAAGYLGLNIPLNRFNIYAGLRYEYTNMELIGNTRNDVESPRSTYYKYNDFFPSLNATYKLTEKQQLRLAYGRTINRPEFRELSSSVYYDFDLASNIVGNSALKPAYIQNVDLRYELYPNRGEQISIAAFYKRFTNPIEWIYTVNGGTDLTYSYKNAKAATNYGIEVDIRKTLDFIGLKNFNWTFNGALIKSEVSFEKGSLEEDRPMQGQSPYLINSGIFYQNDEKGWNVAALYNRIGKRIIGVGRSVGTTGGDESSNIPDSYEMPRNAIDLSASKKWDKWEVKLSIRDILAERVYFKQFGNVNKNGTKIEYEEITKSYKPGRSFSLTVNYIF